MAKSKSGRPRITAARGRVLVREVLNMGQGYGYTEDALLDGINGLASPAEAKWSEVREWVEWNHQNDYLRTEFSEDLDEDLHFITKEGVAKQALK